MLQLIALIFHLRGRIVNLSCVIYITIGRMCALTMFISIEFSIFFEWAVVLSWSLCPYFGWFLDLSTLILFFLRCLVCPMSFKRLG